MDFVGEDLLDDRQKAVLKIATDIAVKAAIKSDELIIARLKRLKPAATVEECVDATLNAVAIMTVEALCNVVNRLNRLGDKETSLFELSSSVNSMVTDRFRYLVEKKIRMPEGITAAHVKALLKMPDAAIEKAPNAEQLFMIRSRVSLGMKVVLADGTII